MIKTFLFDMGNVLLHFSHARMCEQMAALGGLTCERLTGLLLESGIQLDFERGAYTSLRFHDWFQRLAGRPIDLAELRTAASDIFALNAPMAPLLDQLRGQGHRLVLLSNTSEFHFDYIRERYDILDRFDDFVLSYRAGAVKPDALIYETALNVIQCAPHECFYTDDIAAYVEAGRAHGLDAEVFTTPESLREQLACRGIPLTPN